jgi:competence protein ComEA
MDRMTLEGHLNMRARARIAALFLGLTIGLGSPTTLWADRELIVNVNTATEAQLRTLPGIDKVIAGRIVAQRPFKRVNDLLRVDGIGPKVLEKIRPYVKVDGETEPS